ncbi:hypothetical protein ACFFMM_10460 [Micromonospora chaiyaphumensis]|uniref:hypothetical protein n=1 Tax=Micromonospora chaiyaphumensis TaxID=307119 RepID=UPI001428AE59|nr:hypothetical protein [Micromonospora chaiyaphumensis]
MAKNYQSSGRGTYVVVGATGKTGREVERHLTSYGQTTTPTSLRDWARVTLAGDPQ